MGQLIAEIEVVPMIRVWNAMDRPEPTKWRRTMPERAHRWAASFSSVTPSDVGGPTGGGGSEGDI